VAALFGFVQLEFPWALGPPDGRYVLRGHAGEPEHVLVTTTLGAPQRRLLGGRRPAPASAEPEPVATARATFVAASPFTDERAAADWLKAAGEDEIAEAIAVLNRVLHLQRTAAADPAVREVAREQALVSRVGYGEGEEVAHGRWTEAIAHPIPREGRVRRSESLRPQERLAALLGGRDAPLAAEELAPINPRSRGPGREVRRWLTRRRGPRSASCSSTTTASSAAGSAAISSCSTTSRSSARPRTG
jgi:hypothetical protein